MRVALVTLGTSGDVNPFLAVGRELTSRGHDVLVAGNPGVDTRAADAGLEFMPMGDRWELEDLADHPGVLDPRRGPRVVFRDLVIPQIPAIYGATREAIESFGAEVVVSHHIALGAGWACRERAERVPWASVLLSPLGWLSRQDRNVYPPMLPGFLRGFEESLLPMLARWRGDPLINKIRKELGLGRGKDLVMSHAREADLHLGLWSPQLRAPTADDPPRSHVPGFCLYDADASREAHSIEVERELSAEPAPILVSIGSAAVHVDRAFFQTVSRAALELRSRGVRNRFVLLTGRGEPPPDDLASNAVCLPYVRFSSAMPRAALSVIHGGAGSTGQVLRSGRPFVVVPICNDQFDFAARCERLKCARVIRRDRLTPTRLAETIEAVLRDPKIHEAAARVGHLEGLTEGPARAADAIERLARTRRPSRTTENSGVSRGGSSDSG